MSNQIEMPFIDSRSKAEIKEELRLIKYWQEALKDRVRRVFQYRHHTYTTGWSMGSQGFIFALLLYGKKQMTRAQLRRYFRFFRRAARWELKANV